MNEHANRRTYTSRQTSNTRGRYVGAQKNRRDYQKSYLQNSRQQQKPAAGTVEVSSPIEVTKQPPKAVLVVVNESVAQVQVTTNKAAPKKVEKQAPPVVIADVVQKSPKKPTKSKIKAKAKAKKHVTREDVKKPISHHVGELRQRLIWCVFALVIGAAVGYKYQQQIIQWLVKPLQQQLFYTSPAGGFDFLIRICLFFGVLVSVPVIVYNLMRYISPALPKNVAFKTSRIIICSILLAIAGIAFAYYISLPAALHFLSQFTTNQIQSLISAQEYFNFVMIYLAGFAILFQMPLIIAMINKVTPLTPKMLMKKQRVVILVSFIIAAVLTPTPDPINQALMAFPIIGLYQTSVGVVWQDNKRSKRKQKKTQTIVLEQQQTATA